jgi:hypothetical protein
MREAMRSTAALVAAFIGVTVLTVGLALVVVSGTPRITDGEPSDGEPGSTPLPDPEIGGIPGLGGELVVSGDREGTFRLTSIDEGEPYALRGSEGRITFAGRPVTISQISYDGLEFFPEPDDCTLATGNLERALGIAFADVRCRGLVDARGNGTIHLAGELGLPLDRLAERTLPPSGGSVTVGASTWEVADAELTTWQMPIRAGVTEPNLELADRASDAALNIHFDDVERRLSLASVARAGETNLVPDDACTFARKELGNDSPRVLVIELTIDCPSVEVPGLGAVAIHGTLVVDELVYPV